MNQLWLIGHVKSIEISALLHYHLVMTLQRTLAAAEVSAQAFLQRHLKIRQLRLLVVLDQHRHVGRAAEALHITQPAVSKALAELERGLGMSLFTRTSQGLLPTPEGTCLINYAQTVDENLIRTALKLDSIGQPEVWRVAVGAMHGTTPVLSKAFDRLNRQGTQTVGFDLTVEEGPIAALLIMLRAGKLDLVIGSPPERRARANLHITPLYVDPMVWVVAHDHPLARKAGLTLNDLAGTMWVLPPQATRIRSAIDAVFKKLNVIVPSRVVETVSFDTLLGMVCDHGGVALLSRRRSQSAVARGLMQLLDIDMGSLVIQVSAMTVQEPRPMGHTLEFVQYLKEASAQ
jgi:DNA-binding transcriptional LysR family regulator